MQIYEDDFPSKASICYDCLPCPMSLRVAVVRWDDLTRSGIFLKSLRSARPRRGALAGVCLGSICHQSWTTSWEPEPHHGHGDWEGD